MAEVGADFAQQQLRRNWKLPLLHPPKALAEQTRGFASFDTGRS